MKFGFANIFALGTICLIFPSQLKASTLSQQTKTEYSQIQKYNIEHPLSSEMLGPSVVTSTDVILNDGSTLRIEIKVVFKSTAQPDTLIKNYISNWFHGSGDAQGLTLSKFVNDNQYVSRLIQNLQGISDFAGAAMISYSVITPPIANFSDKSRDIVAILKSGETVRVTLGSPPGTPAAPGNYEVGRAYELISTLNMSQIGTLQKQLNDKILPPNNGWGFIVLSLELLSCGCKSN